MIKIQKESVKHGLITALACINRVRDKYSRTWDGVEVNYILRAIEQEISVEIEKLNI